jgi:hypothetical protein
MRGPPKSWIDVAILVAGIAGATSTRMGAARRSRCPAAH